MMLVAFAFCTVYIHLLREFAADTVELLAEPPTRQLMSLPVVDMISTGSQTRMDYLKAQKDIYGKHLRNFRVVTETNDTEKECWKELNLTSVYQIRDYCSSKANKQSSVSSLQQRLYASKQYLDKKGPGWLCAQKRPIDALYRVLTVEYTQQKLPDVLFLVDDDTYLNLTAILPQLSLVQPSYTTGCLSRVRYANFSFPYGGWGVWMTKSTLKRWRMPLNCSTGSAALAIPSWNESTSEKSFQSQACNQLKQNLAGEQAVYEEGMSLIELLHRYVHQFPYLEYVSGANTFCWHSDTVLAYFINYYHLTDHAKLLGDGHPRFVYHEDRITGHRGSLRFAGKQSWKAKEQKKECHHRDDGTCDASAHACHGVTPGHMKELAGEQ